MAEEGSVYDSEGLLEKQLDTLLSRYSSDELRADSKPFCSDFCKLVEDYASHWQAPLPRLRIFEVALRYFARAATFFTTSCDHVLHTLSSLALSVFELLLFFDQKDFHQEPLKHFTVTFQECHSSLTRHQNVHLLQVERWVRGGGPWAGSALQAILSESSLPQTEADGCISSELPVFFELRVRYLLSCERVSEALALAKCCAAHPTAGQHLFFLQVYLTWLLRTSQHDRLHKEVAEFNGKDAVHIICSLECEETDELLLALSRAFLSQQLRRGDMYYLCDLVFIWSELHSRLNTSKQDLLEESHQLMLLATNVNSIFPFIRAVLQELGEDGVQFCVELCVNALASCRPCDVCSKSLIYKTIAGLLPNDLEVSRACALLVFFLERTVETYKMVYLLYMLPDQDYHVEYSPIRNHIRFETLQVLKKDLHFDPEFWNLIALRTNCLKLMSEKVVSGALEEIMEDKWILSYCTKEPASQLACQKGSKGTAAKKRHNKEDGDHIEDADAASKRLRVGKTRLNVDHTVKKKGSSSEPLRRSFWQLDRLQDIGELRRTTRHSEKNPPKRRIRTPKWLLEDSGRLGNSLKKHGLRPQKHHVVKRSEMVELKNDATHKPLMNSHLTQRENSSKGCSLHSLKPATPPQVILELSLPDNELLGAFSEDTFNRHVPQVLLYRPTMKVPAASQPVKTVHRKEVVLRARDAAMFVQQLHCYARRQKGKGSGPNIQGSVSTITRSSVQGSPPKEPLGEKIAAKTKSGITSEVTKTPVLKAQTTKVVTRKTFSEREVSEKPAAEKKVTSVSQTSVAVEVAEAPMSDKVLQAQTVSSAKELCEEPAVEMKVTIASTATNVTPSPSLDKVPKAVKDAVEVSQTPTEDNNQIVTDKISNISNIGAVDSLPSQSQVVVKDGKQTLKSRSPQAESGKNLEAQAKADTPEVLATVGSNISKVDVTDVSLTKGPVPCNNDTTVVTATPSDQDSMNDISALTLVTEMVTELTPEALARDLENRKPPTPEVGSSMASTPGSKSKAPRKVHTTSSCSAVADVHGKEHGTWDVRETPEDQEIPESEESKLEYCCTFCNKVFKGSRVVAHAMFHYRKDECMFCRMMFKDDLLAMMHLSDHIEKLKRIKESAAQENQVETKDISTPKTSATENTTNESSARRSRGRPRKSTNCPKSVSLADSNPSGSRELRSNGKPVDGQPLCEKRQNVSKHLISKTPVHTLNGHIGKKKEFDRLKKDTLKSDAKPLKQREISQQRAKVGVKALQENDIKMDSSAMSAQVKKKLSSSDTESAPVLKKNSKQSGKFVEEKNVEPQEKLCCPVEGCSWFTDLSKNRVGLLYHALEDHYGEVKPLELAFRVGNSKCSSCMRVMWSFEHFQHHVERHRVVPRHPCLHRGCTARFKSGMEMRRHARRHSPLQAVCCLPGCSQLFICLWALNLHEREHYAAKPTKPDKNTNEQRGDKQDNAPNVKKQPDHKRKDATVNTTVSARKLSDASARHVQAPLPTAVGAPVLNEESKEQNETKVSNVLKNLSNKDTAQSTGPNLRLRQTLRKVVNPTKVLSSSLKRKNKVRHKFKKKQLIVITKGPKRRGRPPKVKKAVHDENTTAGQNKSVQLASPAKAAETSDGSQTEETSRQVRDVVKTKSVNKQMKKNPVKQKELSHNTSAAIVSVRKLHKVTKRSAPKSSQMTSSQDSSKPKKVTNSKANTDIVKKNCPLKEAEGRKKTENDGQMASSDFSKSKKVINSKANADIKKNCPLKEAGGKEKAENGGQLAKNTDIVKKNCPLNEAVGEEKTENDGQMASSDSSKSKKPINSEANTDIKEMCPLKGAEGKEKAENYSQAACSDSSKSKKERNSKANTDIKRICPLREAEGKAKAESDDSAPVIAADGLNVKTAPSVTSAQKRKTAERKKSQKKKEGKKNSMSGSGKTNKKHKDVQKRGGKDAQKDASKTSALEKTSVDGQAAAKAAAESSPGTEGNAKEGGSISAAAVGSLNETTLQKATKREKPKKSNVTNNPNNASRKRKSVQKEGDTRIVKKKCRDPSAETQSVPSETTEPPAEVKAEVAASPGYSVITNGQAAKEDVKSTGITDALADYRHKPYMRLPPTAYLDEKYITMPKRRKELSFFPLFQRSPPAQHANATAALQRHRCANCFATFNSAEELQSHVQLHTCSNLFGFDSDDEGSGLTSPTKSVAVLDA